MNPYFYPAEKFAVARRSLMLPHTRGEAESIAAAFGEVKHGLHRLDKSLLTGDAEGWVRKLEEFMDVSRVEGEDSRFFRKAQSFSPDEMIEISRLVDDLAYWFDSKTR